MKITPFLIFSFYLFFPGSVLFSANHVVQVGEKIQDAVDAAAEGDVIIVREGLHVDQGAIVIAKHVRLVREKGTEVTIRADSLTFRDLNESTVLRDFRIENPLILENCKEFGIEDIDLSVNTAPRYGNVTITNSKVIIRSSRIRHFPAINDSEVEVIDCAVSYDLVGSRNTLQVVDSSFRNLNLPHTRGTFVRSSGGGVDFTGGSFVSHGCTFTGETTFASCNWSSHGTTFKANLTSTKSHTKLLRSVVAGTLSHQHKTTDANVTLDCVVFQSRVNILSSLAKRTWVTYSSVVNTTIGEDTEEAYFIGNKILGDLNADSSVLDLVFTNNFSFMGLAAGSSDLKAQYDAPDSDSNWHTAKTINFYPSFIPYVTNQIHRGEKYGSAYCYMAFTYADGSTANSHTATHGSNTWVDRHYDNPFPQKDVIKVQVMVRYSNRYDGRAHERWTFENLDSSPVLTISKAKNVRFYNNTSVSVSIANGFGGSYEIKGNLFWNKDNSWPGYAISAPAPGVSQYNYFQDSGKQATGGINNDLNIVGVDPGFVDADNFDFTLKSDSPLRDQGPTDSYFNDHDGSRNDIGHYGGHMYDVNGSTSVNPVVLSGVQNIFRMRVGESNPIIIKARAAVATPSE